LLNATDGRVKICQITYPFFFRCIQAEELDMSKNNRDLWPGTLAPRDLRTPISVLRRQAEALYQRTKGLLRGELAFDGKEASLTIHFNAVAPAVGNFRFCVLSVYQPIEGFPVRLMSQEPDSTAITANDLDQFEQMLEELLASKWVVANINALWGESIGEG